MNMGARPLGCLILWLLCFEAVFVFAVGDSSASTGWLQEARGGVVRDKKHNVALVSRKGGAGRGKGAHGAANIHRRPPRHSSAPSLVSPSLAFSLLISVILGFIST